MNKMILPYAIKKYNSNRKYWLKKYKNELKTWKTELLIVMIEHI